MLSLASSSLKLVRHVVQHFLFEPPRLFNCQTLVPTDPSRAHQLTYLVELHPRFYSSAAGGGGPVGGAKGNEMDLCAYRADDNTS